MSNRDTIRNELQRLNSSLPVTNSPSFSVPEGYFEGLAANILAKIRSSETPATGAELAELSPLLAGLPKTMPYSVPSFYFENNLQSIPAVDAEIKSPLLAAIGKEMPYDLPRSYFDKLPERLLASVTEEPKGNVVPLFRRTWLRAAAAAVIAGGLILGGLQVFNNKTVNDPTASTPVDTASTPVAVTGPIQQEIKKLSTEDLENFTQTTPETASATRKKEHLKKEAAELLKDVSVSDMESFLSEVPQTDEELFATDAP